MGIAFEFLSVQLHKLKPNEVNAFVKKHPMKDGLAKLREQGLDEIEN
jgi:hypothetical protein